MIVTLVSLLFQSFPVLEAWGSFAMVQKSHFFQRLVHAPMTLCTFGTFTVFLPHSARLRSPLPWLHLHFVYILSAHANVLRSVYNAFLMFHTFSIAVAHFLNDTVFQIIMDAVTCGGVPGRRGFNDDDRFLVVSYKQISNATLCTIFVITYLCLMLHVIWNCNDDLCFLVLSIVFAVHHLRVIECLICLLLGLVCQGNYRYRHLHGLRFVADFSNRFLSCHIFPNQFCLGFDSIVHVNCLFFLDLLLHHLKLLLCLWCSHDWWQDFW